MIGPTVANADPIDGPVLLAVKSHHTAAAVAQPALDALYATDDIVAGAGDRPRPLILVSDSRPPAFAGRVAAAVGAESILDGLETEELARLLSEQLTAMDQER